MSNLPEYKVIQCNFHEATSECAKGARAYVGQLGSHSIRVVARSRSGRWKLKWEPAKRLTNFRLKTMVPSDPVYDTNSISRGWNQEVVDNLNQRSSEVFGIDG